MVLIMVTRTDFNRYMMPTYKPADFVPSKAKGSIVWDKKNKKYIDFASGIAVSSLGHCHPTLNKALMDQSKKIWHLSNLLTNEPALRLAKIFCKHTFAEKVLDPLNKNGDREGCKVKDGKVFTPKGFPEAWKKMGLEGWLSMGMPQEFGGLGLPDLITIAAKEVQLASNQSICIGNTLTTGSANLIIQFGSEEQKQYYCNNMLSGKWSGTMCLTCLLYTSDAADE